MKVGEKYCFHITQNNFTSRMGSLVCFNSKFPFLYLLCFNSSASNKSDIFCHVYLRCCDPANKFIGIIGSVQKNKLIVVMKITLHSPLDDLNIETLASHLAQMFSSPDSILSLQSNFAPLA